MHPVQLFFKQYSKGFTLLETLTAVTILTFIIIGPLSAIVSSSSYAKQTKDVIAATMLAEEGLDLIQNRYDSWYIFCKNYVNASTDGCVPLSGETSGFSAWRLFKEQLLEVPSDGQPSCFADNVYGCSFDTINVTTGVTTTPTRYISNTNSCDTLIKIATSTTLSLEGGGQQVVSYYRYVCNGVASHAGTQTGSSTRFHRSVSLSSIPSSFEGGALQDQQFDDVLVTSKVTFKGVNGVTKVVSSTRFLHARP